MPRYRDVYELANQVGGMYALVVAAAKRAKQLREGRQPVTQCPSSNPLTVAIQELLEGKVMVRPPGAGDDEARAETEVVEVVGTDLQIELVIPSEADEEGSEEPGEDDAESGE